MNKLVILAALAAVPAVPASAHIVFAPAEATAGTYHATMVRVGHGCGTAATTAVRIEIPEGILVARPQPKPGWTVEIERTPLAQPAMNEGKPLNERVAAITWRGALPADQFDEFGLMLKLPAEKSGPLHLPVVQSCGTEQVRWGDIPAPGAARGSVPHPAPVLQVAPAAALHAH